MITIPTVLSQYLALTHKAQFVKFHYNSLILDTITSMRLKINLTESATTI